MWDFFVLSSYLKASLMTLHASLDSELWPLLLFFLVVFEPSCGTSLILDLP